MGVTRAARETRPRRRLHAAARRELTVERAMALFARRGFSGTRTPELARACGVSEGMLYKLFGDKRGLYRAIIRKKIAASGERVFPREAAARRDDEAVLFEIARGLLERMEGDPTFLRLLLYSALEGNELAGMFYRARISRVLEFLSSYVRKRFPRHDPDLAALAFLGMASQFALGRQVFHLPMCRRYTPEQVARAVTALFLRGLAR